MLSDIRLVPPGIVVELHPTTVPIRLRARADASLKVCEYGTSFGGHPHGWCRALRDEAISLPSADGRSHVAFRVTTSNGGEVHVDRLELRWHCVDHRLGLVLGRTEAARPAPVFDC